MAPRANWKGFLRLSLVTCPIALFPATSESEKISFNQINKKTGNRVRYVKVDADTGEEVASEDIIKGYKVDSDRYVEVTKDELKTSRLSPPVRSRSTSSCRAARSMIYICSGPITLYPMARLVGTHTP
jgi:Ku protein